MGTPGQAVPLAMVTHRTEDGNQMRICTQGALLGAAALARRIAPRSGQLVKLNARSVPFSPQLLHLAHLCNPTNNPAPKFPTTGQTLHDDAGA